MATAPPDNPDDWTEEQWLDWLAAVDEEAGAEPEGHPLRHGRSAGTQLMGAAMLGMHRAIYGDSEPQIMMVVDADGDPPDPEELDVQLDPEDPDASKVTIRPWLHVSGDPDGEAPA